MSSLLTCPSCSKKLRVPPDLVGRRVKCPSCGSMFEGNVGGSSPDAELSAPPGLSPDDEPDTEIRRRKDELGEQPDEDEDDEDERPWERRRRRVRRDAEPHRGNLVLVLGIISVSCSPLGLCCGFFGVAFSLASLGLGIPAWVMGRKDLRKMDQGVMDPDGRGQTQGGMVCGMIGTILGGLGLLFYAVLIAFYASLMVWGPPGGRPPAPVAPPPARPLPAPAPRKLHGAAPLRLQDYLPAATS